MSSSTHICIILAGAKAGRGAADTICADGCAAINFICLAGAVFAKRKPGWGDRHSWSMDKSFEDEYSQASAGGSLIYVERLSQIADEVGLQIPLAGSHSFRLAQLGTALTYS
jgi:hypothetical protein